MHRHDTPPTSETGPNGGLMALDVVFLVNKTHLSRGFRLHDGGVDLAPESQIAPMMNYLRANLD